MSMQVHVITIFPALIESFLSFGIPRIAREKGKMVVEAVDLRSFTGDVHRTVDDRPFGGGPGMVMLAPPVFDAVESIENQHGSAHRILLTPTGRPLNQQILKELVTEDRLILLCGRYEGIDERVRTGLEWDEISIGDYVLSGGEVPAMVILDGLARLLPEVLGHPESVQQESFEQGLLDAPHYTRPRSFRGMDVPDVLLSGNHAAVERWRREQALRLTQEKRADLLADHPPKSDSTTRTESR